MKQLGPDFETAFEAGADLDPDSADGKAYDAAPRRSRRQVRQLSDHVRARGCGTAPVPESLAP